MLLNIKLQKLSLSIEQSYFIIGQTPVRLFSFSHLTYPPQIFTANIVGKLEAGGKDPSSDRVSTRIIQHHPTSHQVLLQCFFEGGGVLNVDGVHWVWPPVIPEMTGFPDSSIWQGRKERNTHCVPVVYVLDMRKVMKFKNSCESGQYNPWLWSSHFYKQMLQQECTNGMGTTAEACNNICISVFP